MSDQRSGPIDRRLEERLLSRVRRATEHIGRGTNTDLPLVSNDPTEIEYAQVEVDGLSESYKWARNHA